MDPGDTHSRFTLQEGVWYACEIIGDEFGKDKCSYSPIRVDRVKPMKTGDRILELDFYHANYPEGVRRKTYRLQTIERGEGYLLARSVDHKPVRLLQIYPIDFEWLRRHFFDPGFDTDDIQAWLSRNA